MPVIRSQDLFNLTRKTVTLGFDGFIDSIVRIIHSKSKDQTSFFNSIGEFGKYTLDRADRNFSLELHEVTRKPGGNMPIMALAMAQWKMRVNCIGALGYPVINPMFSAFPENCTLFSFAEPGITTALEFDTNKIILGEMSSLNRTNWDTVKAVIGLASVRDLMRRSDLIGMVNWAELDHASAIWRGVLDEVLTAFSYPSRPVAFFDLSDFSKRSTDEVRTALGMLNEFNVYWKVILGLNKNEAQRLCRILGAGETQDPKLEEASRFIFSALAIDTIVIHSGTEACAITGKDVFSVTADPVSNPVLSTGAGDNFNAGFCTAMLLQRDLPSCLAAGHAFAGFYMQHGKNLTPDNTIQTFNDDDQNFRRL